MTQDKHSERFYQERIASLKQQLFECKEISQNRKAKSFTLIREIKRLRKLIATLSISK